MQFRLFLLPLLCSALLPIFLFTGCESSDEGSSAASSEGLTPSGYRYIHHKSNNGYKPSAGDLMVYEEEIYKNDTTLWRSSIKLGRAQERLMPAVDEIENPVEMAWFEGLSLMSAGDSLTLYQSLDSFSRLPMGLSASDRLTCHFSMKKVISEKTLRKDIDRIVADPTLPRTPSGYVFIMHRDVPGETAQIGDKVAYHEQAFRTGVKWYSTYEMDQPRKAVLPDKEGLPEPVPPSYESLLMMSPGDSATVYQPLAGYENLPPTLDKDGVLIFSIKLLSVTSPEEQQRQAEEVAQRYAQIEQTTETLLKDYLLGSVKGLRQLESGLEYVIIEEGDGPKVTDGSEVALHYAGFLQTNGSMFDNSIGRDDPLTFVTGKNQVIDGFELGVSKLRVGSKAVLFVPSALGYGAQGRPKIPANSDLVFYVEVVGVN